MTAGMLDSPRKWLRLKEKKNLRESERQ